MRPPQPVDLGRPATGEGSIPSTRHGHRKAPDLTLPAAGRLPPGSGRIGMVGHEHRSASMALNPAAAYSRTPRGRNSRNSWRSEPGGHIRGGRGFRGSPFEAGERPAEPLRQIHLGPPSKHLACLGPSRTLRSTSPGRAGTNSGSKLPSPASFPQDPARTSQRLARCCRHRRHRSPSHADWQPPHHRRGCSHGRATVAEH